MCPSYMATRNRRATRPVLARTSCVKSSPVRRRKIRLIARKSRRSWICAFRARGARPSVHQRRCGPAESRMAPAKIRCPRRADAGANDRWLFTCHGSGLHWPRESLTSWLQIPRHSEPVQRPLPDSPKVARFPSNKVPLRRWHRIHANKEGPFSSGRVFLFCDEFTNFNDASVGIRTINS